MVEFWSNHLDIPGGVSEWSIELVLKTSRGVEPLEGSNPSPTANEFTNKNMEKTILSWQTKEFEHYDKGAGWYLTLSIIGAMLVLYQIWQRDYFAAVTILFLVIIVYYFAGQKPHEITAEITDKGVHLNKAFFPYHNLKRFWIVDHDRASQLQLETTAYLNKQVIILLNGQDPDNIALALRKHLPETKPNVESVSQRLARRLRF